MQQPVVHVLGVHRLRITEGRFAEEFEYAYGTGEGEEPQEYEKLRSYFRELLEKVVLLEVLVQNRTAAFSIELFSQAQPAPSSVPRQAPYLEKYLSAGGEQLAAESERYMPTPPEGDLRVVFFLYYWNESALVETPYGPVACPAPTPLPDRLAALTEYEPVG